MKHYSLVPRQKKRRRSPSRHQIQLRRMTRQLTTSLRESGLRGISARVLANALLVRGWRRAQSDPRANSGQLLGPLHERYRGVAQQHPPRLKKPVHTRVR